MGFENFLNDKIFFKKILKFNEYRNFWEKNMISEIENSNKSTIKSKILKSIPTIIKNNSDYIGIFKMLTAKHCIFQAILIVNELLFYHELTCLLKKCETDNMSVEHSLLKFMEKIYISLKSFIEYFRKSLTTTVMKTFYIAFSLFTLQIIKHVNTLEDFLDAKVSEISSFEYMSLPKFSLDFHKTMITNDINEAIKNTIEKKNQRIINNSNNLVIYSYALESEFFNIFLQNEENPKLDISIISFNYKCKYGYEPVNYTNNNYVFTKLNEKFLFHIASTLINHSGLYIKGATHTGKKHTFQANK